MDSRFSQVVPRPGLFIVWFNKHSIRAVGTTWIAKPAGWAIGGAIGFVEQFFGWRRDAISGGAASAE